MARHEIKCEAIEVRTESGICPGMAKTQQGEVCTLGARTPEPKWNGKKKKTNTSTRRAPTDS